MPVATSAQIGTRSAMRRYRPLPVPVITSMRLFVESNPTPIKQALAWQGRMTADVRLPLCELTEASKIKLRATLAALKLV